MSAENNFNNESINGLTKELSIYIIQNHPDMILREGKEAIELFILSRVDGAMEVWSEKLHQGLNEDVAWEFAHKHAYAGLIFSKANLIKQILSGINPNYFDRITDQVVKVAFLNKLIMLSNPLFDKYNVGDNTVVSSELESELKAVILTELTKVN